MQKQIPRVSQREIVRNTLAKYDCLTCGKCCRSERRNFSLLVANLEYNLLPIESLRVDEHPKLYRVHFDNPRCKFSDPRSGCTQYDERPYVCQSFPLIIHEGQVYATSFCPPIADLKTQGIAEIDPKDIKGLPVLNERNVEVILRIGDMMEAKVKSDVIKVL